MKSFLMAFALLSSTFASAHLPKVGDQAVFEGEMSYKDGSSTPLKVSLTIVSITGAEAVVETEVQQMAETRTFQNTQPLNEIGAPSPELLESVCASTGRAMETVTVKAGTFEACTLNSSNEYGEKTIASLAHVPFGIVKVSAENEVGVESLELVSYRFAE
jgi:hypothetical protein